MSYSTTRLFILSSLLCSLMNIALSFSKSYREHQTEIRNWRHYRTATNVMERLCCLVIAQSMFVYSCLYASVNQLGYSQQTLTVTHLWNLSILIPDLLVNILEKVQNHTETLRQGNKTYCTKYLIFNGTRIVTLQTVVQPGEL